jgi:hypothetical protein
VNTGWSEFKNRQKYYLLFQNFRKNKISKIYVKTRSNSNVTGEEFFIKPGRLSW